MKVQIYHNATFPGISKLIVPNIIQNRFDLFTKDYYVFLFNCDGRDWALTATINGIRLNVGIWLSPIPKDTLKSLFKEIFINFKNVKQIRYQHSFSNIGEQTAKGNHFTILLPDKIDELQQRLSSKHRYNLRREKNIIEDDIGPVEYIEYSEIPKDIVNLFFDFKYKTHHFDYHMTPQEYLETYHVTNAYVMKAGGKVLSIVFSCEQCSVTYIENLTYNPLFAKYSPGQVLYNHYLQRLVEKGKGILFLSGGDMAYKKRYGSIEDITYDGIVFRNRFWFFRYRFGLFVSAIKSHIKKIEV